ncbi:hypothetical protein [Oryza sativa Japonica Group]|uniref:Uncharacterized protein n=1 Tax=Oryza sativa subsp. japonica TaxID=39947 RepID=Q656G0_ORYSJ|nr:hypothetical protein [Oryza sativa Japonica Group]BAD53146.1 hypothetical protein [Oryza sativa Japonica Group]
MGRDGGVRLHPLLHPPHVPPRRRPGLVGLLRRVVGVFLCCAGASRRGASHVGGAVREQVEKASAEHAAEMERLNLGAAALHAGGAPEVVPRPLPPSPASPRRLRRGRRLPPSNRGVKMETVFLIVLQRQTFLG